MSIELETVKTTRFSKQTMDFLIEEGFDISLESGALGPDEPTWYCSLYYGDSNSPWKSGTIMGKGEGQTIEEAFDNALDSLEEVIGYNHKKPPTASKIRPFGSYSRLESEDE